MPITKTLAYDATELEKMARKNGNDNACLTVLAGS